MNTENDKYCEGNFPDRSDFKEIKNYLEQGNKRFRRIDGLKPKYPNQSTIRRECTADNGQQPFAIVLSCADSRVPPELIFDRGIADLFVVRVAGNIANISSIASIEFAVAVLGCQYILVLGHEKCGAVEAAIAGGDPASPSLEHLVNQIKPAVRKCGCESDKKNKENDLKDGAACLRKVTIENAHHSASELLNHSEILRRKFLDNELAIQTAYYNLASGKVDFDLASEC